MGCPKMVLKGNLSEMMSNWQTSIGYEDNQIMTNIYMTPPKGFKEPRQEDKVIHLKQAIYGLRQSVHEWYKDLMSTLTNISFQRCRVKHHVLQIQPGCNNPYGGCG